VGDVGEGGESRKYEQTVGAEREHARNTETYKQQQQWGESRWANMARWWTYRCFRKDLGKLGNATLNNVLDSMAEEAGEAYSLLAG
jgi:hypothetical protein